MGSIAAEARERDRLVALEARTTALRTLPIVAVAWLVVVVFVRSELVLRMVTLAAIVLSVMLAGRAAVTTRAFLQRWAEPEATRPPAIWVTLVAVAGAVATFVAGANFAADLDAGRPTVRAIAFGTAFLAVTLAAVYAHIAGARGLTKALRDTSSASDATDVADAAEAEPDDAAAAVRLVAAPMVELRLLMAACPPADAVSTLDPVDLVAEFRRAHPSTTVEAAHAELAGIRGYLLHERTLAQVITLLGCAYHPPDDGMSYTSWVARLEAALSDASNVAAPAAGASTTPGTDPPDIEERPGLTAQELRRPAGG